MANDLYNPYHDMNMEDPGKYHDYRGKYLKITYMPSYNDRVERVVHVKVLRVERNNGYCWFQMCEMIPRKDPEKLHTLKANQVVSALTSGRGVYDHRPTKDAKKIFVVYTDMNEIRQERSERIVRSIMGS
jgi:hypothetical protein